MKYLLSFILFLNSFYVFSQSTPPDWRKANSNPSANFYDVQDSVSNYYRTYPNQDTGEGNSQKEFLRWQEFWQNRVGSVNQIGSFTPSANALLNLFQNPICASSSLYPANWQLLGPITQAGNTNIPPYMYYCHSSNPSDPINMQTLGTITSIAYDPTNNIIYAGTGHSGLWASNNDGANWNDLTASTHLPGLGIMDIEIDPNSPNVIYIASGKLGHGYGIGVLKSTNFGLSWSQTGLTYTSSQQKNTLKVIADPSSSSSPNPCTTLYALVDNEIWKSTDVGTNWFILSNATLPANASGYARQWRDMVMKPMDSNTIYVSSEGDASSDGSVIWVTTDAGSTWTDITPPLPLSPKLSERIAIAVSPVVPDNLWVTYSYCFSNCTSSSPTIQSVVQKSIDGGTTWTTLYNSTAFDGQGYWRNDIVISPTDPDIIYVGGYCIYKTLDGGNSWSSGQGNGHMDTRCLLIVQGSTIGTGGTSDIVLNGNDGGVSKTTNGGSSWQNINGTGLSITEFYGIGGSELAPNLIIGGTQDNGAFVYDNGNWSNYANGDASSSVIDVINPNFGYVQRWNGFPPYIIDVYSNPANPSLACSTYPPDFNLRTVKPMLMHKNGYLYVGHHDVWKIASSDLHSCNNSGWQNISNFNTVVSNSGGYLLSTQALSALAVAPSNDQVIYAGYENPTWNSNYTTNPPCVCDPNNAQACNPMPSFCPVANKLFRTTDGGTTWTDITDIGYDNVNGLEAVRWFPISDITVSSTNPSELWVSFGGFVTNLNNISARVMHSTDGGNTWNDYSNGLTEFPVNTIVYEKGSNDGLYIGTDAGVFYTNKDLYQTQGWVCFNDNLPTTIISDLDINYATNTIRAATLGRGVWLSPLACPTNPDLTFDNSNNTTSGVIASGFYEAENNINVNANTNITNSGDVTMRAGSVIDITATGSNSVDFTPTSNVHLFIHGCSHSGNSFRQQNDNNNSGNNTAQTTTDKPITQGDNFKFTYYPNPFTDHLHIDFMLDKTSPVLVSVYNSQGQLIQTLANGAYQAGEYTLVFDNPSTKPGVYFVRLDIGDKHYAKAVLKNEE